MFNNYSCSQNTKINAVTGGILKNHPKSWFKRLHLGSSYAEKLFVPNGDIVVLQMMICGDCD